MTQKPEKWDLETEVLVVGTGGAALTAAILAHDNGAKVTVIERSDQVGGATAVSGGLSWVPNNHHVEDEDHGQGSDSRDKAMVYVKVMAAGRVQDELIEAFVDPGPQMIRYLEENTTMRFLWSGVPDYHPEHPGGMKAGRSLGPPLFDTKELGDFGGDLRSAPVFTLPMSWDELEKNNCLVFPQYVDFELMTQRAGDGMVGMGRSLIGHLLKACLDRGIKPILKTRAKELIEENGCVTGLRSEQEGKSIYIRADKGVILACGGFEWNEEMKAQFLPGNICRPCTPPPNEGDGQKMAMAVGAGLGNMCEVWGTPVSIVPNEEYEGRPLYRMTIGERGLPHAIMVNRFGERFVNESCNYSDIYKTFNTLDPVAYDYPNVPSWCIFDQQFKDKYTALIIMPGEPAPDWLERADTVEDLAKKVGIDAEGLESTVKQFNSFAVEGVDCDFQRGESAHDIFVCGDPTHKPNPCLGTIEKPPFYALPVYPGAIGTKGGSVTNAKGQVLDSFGQVIEGLYAAGNVMAGVTGPGYGGGGGTIGPAMTWGYICGKNAAK